MLRGPPPATLAPWHSERSPRAPRRARPVGRADRRRRPRRRRPRGRRRASARRARRSTPCRRAARTEQACRSPIPARLRGRDPFPPAREARLPATGRASAGARQARQQLRWRARRAPPTHGGRREDRGACPRRSGAPPRPGTGPLCARSCADSRTRPASYAASTTATASRSVRARVAGSPVEVKSPRRATTNAATDAVAMAPLSECRTWSTVAPRSSTVDHRPRATAATAERPRQVHERDRDRRRRHTCKRHRSRNELAQRSSCCASAGRRRPRRRCRGRRRATTETAGAADRRRCQRAR